MPTPETLFRDITYLGDDDTWKDRIERDLLRQGYIPFIDRLGGNGEWVWHTLLLPNGSKSVKHIAAQCVERRARRSVRNESEIESAIAADLRRQGYAVRQQVRCTAGIADIVTDDAIYEVEQFLDRAALFMAAGQVLIYRQAINPALRAVVIALGVDSTAKGMLSAIAGLGVEVQIWKGR
jgi:hypothetical protein